jgi:hypothetical protein
VNKALTIGDIVFVPPPQDELGDIHETAFTGTIVNFKAASVYGECVVVRRMDGEEFDIEIDRVEKAE